MLTSVSLGSIRRETSRWSRVQRAVIVALLISLATVVTVFALSLFVVNPFTGSIYDIGDNPEVTSVLTNDDNVESTISGDWDQTDTGMDPSELHPSSSPYIVSRNPFDLQFCEAIINGGGGIDITMTNANTGSFCAVWARTQGLSTVETFDYVGAVVTGTDQIEIVEQPACGSLTIAPAGLADVVLQLAPSGTAVPGSVWDGATASIDVEWAVAGTYTCP